MLPLGLAGDCIALVLPGAPVGRADVSSVVVFELVVVVFVAVVVVAAA